MLGARPGTCTAEAAHLEQGSTGARVDACPYDLVEPPGGRRRGQEGAGLSEPLNSAVAVCAATAAKSEGVASSMLRARNANPVAKHRRLVDGL